MSTPNQLLKRCYYCGKKLVIPCKGIVKALKCGRMPEAKKLNNLLITKQKPKA